MDKNSQFQADIVVGVPRLIRKEMVRESVGVIKNKKAPRQSVVIGEMVFVAAEAEFDTGNA